MKKEKSKLSKLKLNKFVVSELEQSKLSQIKGGYGQSDTDCCEPYSYMEYCTNDTRYCDTVNQTDTCNCV